MISADEKFVREHWVGQDPIEVFLIDDPMPEFCSASVRIRGFGPCFYRSTQEEAWAAAAEFTRERLKDIAACLLYTSLFNPPLHLSQRYQREWRRIIQTGQCTQSPG